MKVNYGYKDGAGDWFITLDTDKCDGCGDCIEACPADILELVENEYEVMSEQMIPAVKEEHKKSIRYDCSPCKSPSSDREKEREEAKCAEVCHADAFEFSW